MCKKIVTIGLLLVMVSGLSGLTGAQERDFPPTHLRSLWKTQVQDGLISQKPVKAGENDSGRQLTSSPYFKHTTDFSPDGKWFICYCISRQ